MGRISSIPASSPESSASPVRRTPTAFAPLPPHSSGTRTDRSSKVVSVGKSDWQVGRRNCAPDCALTGVYPRQTLSLTGKHRETCFRCQVVEAVGEKVLRYVSTSVQRLALRNRGMEQLPGKKVRPTIRL